MTPGSPGHGARSPFCSWTVLRPAWAEYYAGPGILTGHEKEGPRPWPGFFEGLQSKAVFLFFQQNRYNLSPPSGGRAFIHFEANARRERRDARYVKQKRARSSSGTKKGFKKHLFKVTLPQRVVGVAPRHPDTPPPYSVSERDEYMTVWI